MNLIEEIDELSSRSYISRVVARTLGHAIDLMGLTVWEAREIWLASGFSLEAWDKYQPKTT